MERNSSFGAPCRGGFILQETVAADSRLDAASDELNYNRSSTEGPSVSQSLRAIYPQRFVQPRALPVGRACHANLQVIAPKQHQI